MSENKKKIAQKAQSSRASGSRSDNFTPASCASLHEVHFLNYRIPKDFPIIQKNPVIQLSAELQDHRVNVS